MNTEKDPKATRLRILEVAAEEMAAHGYKAASLSVILAKSGVSKGALYHHFPSKLALGHAVIDELYSGQFQEFWSFPLEHEDPLEALGQFLLAIPTHVTEEAMTEGCPVCHLAIEMSAEEESFRERVQALFEWLRKRVQAAFTLAGGNGQLRAGVVPEDASRFLVAGIQGVQMQAKYMDDKSKVIGAIQAMVDYLTMLKTSP